MGYLLVSNDPSWFGAMSGGMSEGRDPTATTAFLRHTLYDDGGGKAPLALLATYLFSHNAQIAIFAFALGFAFCLPTAFLLAQNGMVLGALLDRKSVV